MLFALVLSVSLHGSPAVPPVSARMVQTVTTGRDWLEWLRYLVYGPPTHTKWVCAPVSRMRPWLNAPKS